MRHGNVTLFRAVGGFAGANCFAVGGEEGLDAAVVEVAECADDFGGEGRCPGVFEGEFG